MMHLLLALFVLGGIALLAGMLLGFTATKCKIETNPIVASIDALLPQTQCGQCGYPGCAPYAAAVAQGEAINKCVPGGQAVISQLADLLHIVPPAPATQHLQQPIKKVAIIDEDFCIGCTKCLQACPVDAIIGTTKALHTVLTDLCTGCDLCVPTCPTNCIQMIPLEQLAQQQTLLITAHAIPPKQHTA